MILSGHRVDMDDARKWLHIESGLFRVTQGTGLILGFGDIGSGSSSAGWRGRAGPTVGTLTAEPDADRTAEEVFRREGDVEVDEDGFGPAAVWLDVAFRVLGIGEAGLGGSFVLIQSAMIAVFGGNELLTSKTSKTELHDSSA